MKSCCCPKPCPLNPIKYDWGINIEHEPSITPFKTECFLEMMCDADQPGFLKTHCECHGTHFLKAIAITCVALGPPGRDEGDSVRQGFPSTIGK